MAHLIGRQPELVAMAKHEREERPIFRGRGGREVFPPAAEQLAELTSEILPTLNQIFVKCRPRLVSGSRTR
jgi:hypothetical protein